MEQIRLIIGDATWDLSSAQDLVKLREGISAVMAADGGFLDFVDSSHTLRSVVVTPSLVATVKIITNTVDEPSSLSLLVVVAHSTLSEPVA
ncbi:hypothetical protein [Herbiconiux ginsengi]|uniref:Uncharacterized protein n=1 Tax=Herbiconiux ginsengi TaxID=381665 RepID=A0A1H3SNJ4_9MICO|nr:hypothetical protein [Herbiconiux ginsengi]SDZ39556.1 hypothetical protein SAMN05216554_3530 [Herbiconiux ginsengi]